MAKEQTPGSWFDAKPEKDSQWQRLLSEFETGLARAALAHDPGHVDALQMLGASLTRLGRHDEALTVDRQVVHLAPADPIARYNLACSLSNLEHVDEAFRELDQAVELGYKDFRYLEQDPDLENVRRDARYGAFVAKARERVKERQRR